MSRPSTWTVPASRRTSALIVWSSVDLHAVIATLLNLQAKAAAAVEEATV